MVCPVLTQCFDTLKVMLENVTIDKLVHGGQGLGTLPDGRKVFVWNALPGETVRVRIIKTKRSYAEAIAHRPADIVRILEEI
jgi:tRNA/tmRNA/rRNA uracil-C5-methylase (TrmA/RlmC/RlmD family)